MVIILVLMFRSLCSPAAAGSANRPCQRVPESDLLRDAVLLLQGIDGRYTRFQDTSRDIARNRSGLPLHPLEQKPNEARIEGQLLFVVHDDNVSRISRHFTSAHDTYTRFVMIVMIARYTCRYQADSHTAGRSRMALSPYLAVYRE